MANHASAKKRIRRNARRAVINKARVSRMRTFIKKVESAIEEKDVATAEANMKQVQIELYRNMARGVIHKNTAARKLSRLSASVKGLKSA